jgi:hypothetical protein
VSINLIPSVILDNGCTSKEGKTLFLDDQRGLVAFHDDRAALWIYQALERHREDVTDLLMGVGWFSCHCEHCIRLEGVH